MDKIDVHFFLNAMNTKRRIIVLLDAVNEVIEGYNKHRKEYIAVLDRIEDILDRLRQLDG